jgi:hypothetical protein
MTEFGRSDQIDFTVDKSQLYREESFTDLKVASIRRMIPVKADGADDTSRSPMFFGHTQLMSPEGPLPIQARLTANNLEEAIAAFPAAMEQALGQVVQQIKAMQEQNKTRQQNDSRIIVPGR